MYAGNYAGYPVSGCRCQTETEYTHIKYFDEQIVADGICDEHAGDAEIADLFLFLQLQERGELRSEHERQDASADTAEVLDEILIKRIGCLNGEHGRNGRKEQAQHGSYYAQDDNGKDVYGKDA